MPIKKIHLKKHLINKFLIKIQFLLLFLLLFYYTANGTPQAPDYLFYEDNKLILRTGWGHPSPLETYYSQNNIEYPFEMLSTGNYRGFVAFWEVKNNKLYLREIWVGIEKHRATKFVKIPQTDTISSDTLIHASWFSGIIECDTYRLANYKKYNITYYFQIREGNVIDIQALTYKDKKLINKNKRKNIRNKKLLKKENMLKMNDNYVSYYYRLHEKDTIVNKNEGGYFVGKNGVRPILLFYDNKHTKWPYNWENLEKSGAPNCKWIIEDNKIFLTKIYLYSGTSFYSIDKDSIELNILFNQKANENKVLGAWVSGIFLITFGDFFADERLSDYKEFKASKYTFLRINKGIINEQYTVSSDFNFKEIPEKTEPGLKKIIEDFGD